MIKKKKKKREEEEDCVTSSSFPTLFLKKRSTPSACVLVFLLVLVFRRRRRSKTAAIQEQLFERRRKKKKKKKRVLLFLFGGDAQVPREHLCVWGKMTTDRKYVRARGGGGLEHRFSFICVVVDVSRRGSAPTVSVLRVSFPRFFVFRATRFYAGERARLRAKVVAHISSLSFSLSLSYRARFAET